MIKYISASILAALSLSAVACGGSNASNSAATMPNATAVDSAKAPMAASDIVDTANAAGSFKTLVAAIKAADLVDTLKGPGPFTVFAPTDEAFAKLPAGTLDSLLKPENKAKLQGILTYHVVSGRVGSNEAMSLSTAKTVQGKSLKVSHNAGGVMVDGAKVVKTDIQCTNGVIHVIDAVVLP